MKKTGFTLIELLAVIVILAIIALIATPIVMNLIENSKRGAAERAAENIEKAAELYYYENRLDGLFPGITFTCNGEKCSSNDKLLEINGKVPEIGYIKIDKEGVITLNSIIINGYKCYKENESYKCNKVTKEIASSTDGMVTLDSKFSELGNYRIYGNSVFDEYQQVEYIKSSGTQYIDTGYIGSNKTSLEIKQSFEYNSIASGASYCAIGTADTSSDNSTARIEMGYDTISNTYWSNCGSVISRFHKSITPNYMPHVFEWDGTGYFAIDNNVAFQKKSLSSIFNSSTSIYLFKDNKRLSNWCPVELHYAKIYDEGILVRDFISVYRKSDNVIGLYDLVEGKFYENKGTGSFSKGPDVTGEIEGTESVGNYNSNTNLYEIPVKVTNKNLYKESKFTSSNGLSIEYNPDTHIYTINGTTTTTGNIWLSNKFVPDVKVGEDVTLTTEIVSGTINNNGKYVYYSMFNDTNKSYIRNQNSFLIKPGKISKSAKMISGEYMHYCIQVGGEGVTFNNVELRVQLEKGKSSTKYEPYKEENYTISLTEPLRCVDDLCDYIDYKSGKVVRNVGVESNGTLVKLEKSITQDIDLPNIKLNNGTNNIYVKTDIIPSKVEMEYYK